MMGMLQEMVEMRAIKQCEINGLDILSIIGGE